MGLNPFLVLERLMKRQKEPDDGQRLGMSNAGGYGAGGALIAQSGGKS